MKKTINFKFKIGDTAWFARRNYGELIMRYKPEKVNIISIFYQIQPPAKTEIKYGLEIYGCHHEYELFKTKKECIKNLPKLSKKTITEKIKYSQETIQHVAKEQKEKILLLKKELNKLKK